MSSTRVKFIMSLWATLALLGVVVWMYVEIIRESGGLTEAPSIVAGVAVVLAIFLTWSTGSRVASNGRSIQNLTESAEQITKGDFSIQVSIPAENELKGLANAFNEMTTKLNESYEKLELEAQRDIAILHNMSEGLIATDQNGSVTLINQAAMDLLGLTPEVVIIGVPIDKLAALKNAEGVAADHTKHPVYTALSKGAVIEDILDIDNHDKKRSLRFSASPIVVKKKVAGSVVLVRDITREKEIDRMKTEFISIASHQLRTPLSAVKWFSEMLTDGDAGELSKEQKEIAVSVLESSKRMIELVNALLNISRIESGRLIVDPKPTNLATLVQRVVEDLRVKMNEKKQNLTVDTGHDMPTINIDPQLITQVYLNLISNATKYTQDGGDISIRVWRKDDQIISEIKDNGYGIPWLEQGKLFQKFFRASNVVKLVSDGTGLGMYLVKAVVETSGGKIWFDSEEGKGSTFWFSLPVSGTKPKSGEVTIT